VSNVKVVVPAFNEEATIAPVVAAIQAEGFGVVVVDDGSRDQTREVAAQAGATVLALPFNLGVGGALRAGLLYASREADAIAVQCDADGQHPPAEIKHLLEALDGADIVIGSRFAGKGAYVARGPRRWAMTMLGAVMSRLHHVRLSDVTSGFRAFSPQAVSVLAQRLPPDYLADTVLALMIAKEYGLRVTQVPVEMRERQGGMASSGPFRSVFYLARAVMLVALGLLSLGLRSASRRLGGEGR
jgi:glycosyltransferase involved in cell wall biosynthesis